MYTRAREEQMSWLDFKLGFNCLVILINLDARKLIVVTIKQTPPICNLCSGLGEYTMTVRICQCCPCTHGVQLIVSNM